MAMIECRKCDSHYCDGCNIYTLSKMLLKGELDCLMDDSHSIARTPESLRPKWISVEDRLPGKQHGWVLVACKFVPEGWRVMPYIAELRNGVWWADCHDTPLAKEGIEVTHWMPLPEPPKE